MTPPENAAPLCTRHVPGFGRCGLSAADHEPNRLNHPYEHETTPVATAADHEHQWHDTGFSDLDECACGATRSATTGRVIEADELAALKQHVGWSATEEWGD